MKRVQIQPSWSFADQDGARIDAKLFTLLRAVHQHGRLNSAAEALGCSYRHTWNLLNRWSAFFGADIVAMQRGKGAQLTSLGEKLLWAEQRVAARLSPQLASLASEINLALHQALADASPILRMCASHGYAVALLPDFAEGFQLDLQYESPLDALASLNRGACDIAGFHIPRHPYIPELVALYSRLLNTSEHVAIRFVSRTQGLAVPTANPLGITGFSDLARPGLRFINRQLNSGSRFLVDALLQEARLTANEITGYDSQEFTHGAIAAYVAAGMADTGFCVEAAARQFGLDFIPLTTEDYVLACRRDALDSLAIGSLLEQMRSQHFAVAMRDLPGYAPIDCGDLIDIATLLQMGTE